MIQIVHAAAPGRVRYRVGKLYHSESLKKRLELRLAAQEGITSVSANPLTGTVLILFKTDSAFSASTIAKLIEKVTAEHQSKSSAAPDYNFDARNEPKDGQESRASKYSSPVSGSRKQTASAGNGRTQRPRSRAETQPQEVWHSLEVDRLLATLRTTKDGGLSAAEARARLQTSGPNVLAEAQPQSGLSVLLDQLASLPVALLTAAAGISLFTAGIADAVIIMGVVAINATIGYVIESRSERTIHSLKKLTQPSAVVIRDGGPQEIQAREVVVGDLLILQSGSYLAADGRLIAAEHLSVDESALTGESLPVSKSADPLAQPDLPLADRANMVYMGTLVTSGQGLAVVVATGRSTEIGAIQALAGAAQSPETPLERQLGEMGTQLVIISGAVCGLVFGAGLLWGYSWLEMLTTSISLAVAAVPEGLPAVATTTLALGLLRMRSHHVLIRRLEVVETLGCMQTICLDKTGTLTMNEMAVVSLYAGRRQVTVKENQFLRDEERIDPSTHEELVKLAQVCVLCSEIEIERHDEQLTLNGSATEKALIHLAITAGIDVTELRETYPVLEMHLRSETRNFMRTLHHTKEPGPQGRDDGSTALFVAVKGSPIEVLALCRSRLQDGEKVILTEEDRLHIQTANEQMAGNALRVLGVAYTDEGEARTDSPEQANLTWLGLVGMADPIRPGVAEIISRFHRAGIDTVMITGDQSPTAYAIGKQLRLSRNSNLEMVDSTDLDNVNPEILQTIAAKAHIFSRVGPAQKLQIVQAFQQAGKVVAMTGDGINDGPALKVADIGIAMGDIGTDVVREVADVVLEDDNLETMVVAISQGRTIYNNIRKSVRFLLSTNLSEIMLMFTAIAAGLGQPLTAMQLLWINLLSDIFPSLALALEPPEPEVLTLPPRDPAEPILRTADFQRIAFESATLSAGALGAYGYGLLRYGQGPQASTLAFTSLTSGQLLHTLTSRSEHETIWDETTRPPNPYLRAALIGSFALQGLALTMPGLRSLLGIAPMSLLDSIVIGGSALLPFLVNENTKKSSASKMRKPHAHQEEMIGETKG